MIEFIALAMTEMFLIGIGCGILAASAVYEITDRLWSRKIAATIAADCRCAQGEYSERLKAIRAKIGELCT